MPIKSYSITAQNYAYGADFSSGAENLPPEALTVATNARYSRNGGVFVRQGFESKATALGSSVKIDTIFTHETYDVMFCKTGTKIMQSLDGITWYDIGVARTASARDFFFSFGGDVFVTNTTDGFMRIAVSTLATAITGASTTVVVKTGDGDKFTNGVAVIYIEGDEINYTAVSTDTLTTVTNIGASHAAGTIITQTTALASAPKGSCIGELEDSLLVGGVTASPNVLYFSGPATAANPEFAWDFSANGAGSKLFPSDVTALGTITGGVLIGLKKGIHFASEFQLDTGALLSRPVHGIHGVNNAFCFAQGDKRTYALTNTKRILPILNDQNGVQVVDDDSDDRKNLDYPIRSILNGMDEDQALSFAHFDPVTAEQTSSILIDGISQELVFNEDLGKWSTDIGQTYSCKTNFKKRVYAGSDSTDSVFLVDEGSTDDTLPILFRVVTGVYTMDDKRVSSDYLKFTFGGLLSGAGEFTFRIYVNGNLVEEVPVTASDLEAKNLIDLSSGIPLGSGLVGATTVGSSGSTPLVYPFTLPYQILHSGETFQAEWESFDEGTSFQLNDSRLDAETSGELYLDSF